MPRPSFSPSLPPFESCRTHIDKEAENGQAIGAPGGSTEIPIKFLIEVDELHLGEQHGEEFPSRRRREWEQLWAFGGPKSD